MGCQTCMLDRRMTIVSVPWHNHRHTCTCDSELLHVKHARFLSQLCVGFDECFAEGFIPVLVCGVPIVNACTSQKSGTRKSRISSFPKHSPISIAQETRTGSHACKRWNALMFPQVWKEHTHWNQPQRCSMWTSTLLFLWREGQPRGQRNSRRDSPGISAVNLKRRSPCRPRLMPSWDGTDRWVPVNPNVLNLNSRWI